MSKSGIEVEKDFGFYVEVLIATFVSFFAVYPVVLDILDKRPNAVDGFYISVVFAFMMMVCILLIANHLAKKEGETSSEK